ncbi:MAG: hypothetical protein INR66_23865 [Gordonia polyisoprenivorans]|nr:hypothetical protein [Gordonia polyisoprenivorans]
MMRTMLACAGSLLLGAVGAVLAFGVAQAQGHGPAHAAVSGPLRACSTPAGDLRLTSASRHCPKRTTAVSLAHAVSVPPEGVHRQVHLTDFGRSTLPSHDARGDRMPVSCSVGADQVTATVRVVLASAQQAIIESTHTMVSTPADGGTAVIDGDGAESVAQKSDGTWHDEVISADSGVTLSVTVPTNTELSTQWRLVMISGNHAVTVDAAMRVDAFSQGRDCRSIGVLTPSP